MNSSVAKKLRAVMAILFFVQLAGVLYLSIDAAGVEVDEAYTLYGITEVAPGTSAWFRLENASVHSGRLQSADSVTVEASAPFERQTVHTNLGVFDVIEVPRVHGTVTVTTAVRDAHGAEHRHVTTIRPRSPGTLVDYWSGASDHRSFHSVVSGYEKEGVHWSRPDVTENPGNRLRLHLAVEGGTLQALMPNAVHLLVTGEDGMPVAGAAIVWTRESFDGEQRRSIRTDSLGLASATVQLEHQENWAFAEKADAADSAGAPLGRARVVPARDGVRAFLPDGPVVHGDDVAVGVDLQGTRGTGFVHTSCTDASHTYRIVGLPGGQAIVDVANPSVAADGPRICRVQVSTAAGYAEAARALTAYLEVPERMATAEAAWRMLEAASSSLRPTPLTREARAWQPRIEEASDGERRRLLRFLLASGTYRFEPLARLYESRASVEGAVEDRKNERLVGFRWILAGELVAGLCLLLAFVIPMQLRASKALARFEADDDGETTERFDASVGSVILYWGLLVGLLALVVVGFVYLLTVIS